MTEPAKTKPADVAALEDLLGHRFAKRELIVAALRHSSLTPDGARKGLNNFERLEFLGDRVLGLVVADLLLDRFPRESEGDLARRHAVLVSRTTLAEIAAAIGLGRFLRLARGERASGGDRNPAVLADALEAIIGALYRDGGLEPAAAFIAREFAPRLSAATAPPRDPKTALQEWAQARGLPLPSYRTLTREGPAHQPSFRVEVRVTGHEPESAKGSSKRVAERAAASSLLARLSGHDER